jgi:hypothetical protein
VANGETESIRSDLRRAFRTMLQRARDVAPQAEEPEEGDGSA